MFRKGLIIKLFFTGMVLFLLTSGCTNDITDSDNYDIEGRYMHSTALDSAFNLFVEDSLTGNTYIHTHVPLSTLPENYLAEVYQIQINADTIFISEKSGEEMKPNLDLSPNQQMFVKVNEEFKPYKQHFSEHITGDLRLLPIYVAERVLISDYTSKDFIDVHTPMKENHYIIYISDETFNIDYLGTLKEFASHHQVRNKMIFDLRHNDPLFSKKFPKVTNEPVFLIISSDGEVLRTENWKDVHKFFQMKEIEIPSEGDSRWEDFYKVKEFGFLDQKGDSF